MPNFNKVFLMGHLTKDAELRNTANGAVLNWSIAYNEEWQDKSGAPQKRVHYFDCCIFGKRAEGLATRLKKGMPLFVEGRLSHDQWDDKDTGKKMHRYNIVAGNIEFVSGARPQAQGEAQPPAAYSPPHATAAPRPAMMDDDDIPF